MRGTPPSDAPGQTPARPDGVAVFRYLAYGETGRPFLSGAVAPARAGSDAAFSAQGPVDLDVVRAAIAAQGGPLAWATDLPGVSAERTESAPASTGRLTGLARTGRDAAARLASSRERAAVPVQALLHSSFVDENAGERPAAVSGGRAAALLDSVLPPARTADEDATATVLLSQREPVREVFASDSFAARPYVDAPTVRALFEDFLAHPGRHDAGLFWRLLNLELWLRDAVDATPSGPAAEASATADGDASGPADPAGERQAEPASSKPDHEPNPGKQLDLVSSADGRTYRRFPVQTDLVSRDTDLMAYLRPEIEDFFRELPAEAMPQDAPWHFSVSEKIVAITQGRSYYTWEIRPGVAARVLSRLVTRTPAGIGLGDPTTMQLAIQEAGLPRIAFSAAAGAAGKLAGRRGVFYNVVGGNVRAIDGPTTYSAFPANVSAKLPPADPDGVARQVSAMIRSADLPDWAKASFAGTVIMDANDIGRNALGSDCAAPAEVLEEAFADNPLGQGRERTPLAVVVRMD